MVDAGITIDALRSRVLWLWARGLRTDRARLRLSRAARLFECDEVDALRVVVAAWKGLDAKARDALSHTIEVGVDGVKATRKAPSADEEAIASVFTHWQQTHDKARCKATPVRLKRIRARLAEGFAPDDLRAAIEGALRDDWLMGRAEGSRGYNDLTTILRDAAQVERLRDLAQEPVEVGFVEHSASEEQIATALYTATASEALELLAAQSPQTIDAWIRTFADRLGKPTEEIKNEIERRGQRAESDRAAGC